MPKSPHRDHIDRLMKRAMEAHSSKEANATIDELGEKFGEDAVYAIEEIIDRTRFDEVRAHGLQVIRDAKSEDTKF